MPEFVAITPPYETGNLASILEIEERQIEDTVVDLTEEQMEWRPTPNVKSALDILWHLACRETVPYPGAGWSSIRHLCYHLGELVYLRKAMGLDEPKYYHQA